MLHPKEQLIYDIILEYHSKKGQNPTVYELCRNTGPSYQQVLDRCLKSLEKKGYIEVDAQIPRRINLLIRF